MPNLKEIRERKGMSQAEVARQVDIARQTYNNYELGKRQADYETLLKLADVLETTVEEIIADVSESIKKLPLDEKWERIKENFAKLSDADIDKVDDYVQLLAERAEASKA